MPRARILPRATEHEQKLQILLPGHQKKRKTEKEKKQPSAPGKDSQRLPGILSAKGFALHVACVCLANCESLFATPWYDLNIR